MNGNAVRMQLAVDFVAETPGVHRRALIQHLFNLEHEALTVNIDEKRRGRLYKKAAGVVDRVLRDRLVRQDDGLRLYPWDERRKAYAEALERAAFAAPDPGRFERTLSLACEAWRDAGDFERARSLQQSPRPSFGTSSDRAPACGQTETATIVMPTQNQPHG